jgi:hypothetical protein
MWGRRGVPSFHGRDNASASSNIVVQQNGSFGGVQLFTLISRDCTVSFSDDLQSCNGEISKIANDAFAPNGLIAYFEKV